MRSRPGLLIPLVVLSVLPHAAAQSWDASRLAKGWARIDITGAAAFLDAQTQALQLWTADDSLFGTIPYQKVGALPEHWLFDSRNNAWVTAGATLYYVDKTGKVLNTLRLPSEVADLTWDARAMYLTYRSVNLFVEKRDLRSGDVTWSHGTRPTPQNRTQVPLYRIAMADDGKSVFVAGGGDVGLMALDVQTGKPAEAPKLAPEAGVPAALQLTEKGRLPIHTWHGRPVIISCATGSELNSGTPTLHLLLSNLETRKVTLFKTELTTDHQFIGMIDTRAVFTKPGGGLVFVSLQ